MAGFSGAFIGFQSASECGFAACANAGASGIIGLGGANGCSRFPSSSRILLATHPDLLSTLLQIIHRVIATFLTKQSGRKRGQAHSGAVTLIQLFGSAANLNIHLHWQVADGLYRSSARVPVFHEARAPTIDELQSLLSRIIQRVLKLLARTGYLVEEQGMTYDCSGNECVCPDKEIELTRSMN